MSCYVRHYGIRFWYSRVIYALVLFARLCCWVYRVRHCTVAFGSVANNLSEWPLGDFRWSSLVDVHWTR